MAGTQPKPKPTSSCITSSQIDSPVKGADGTSFHSDQSSNLSECSQVLQYFNCPDSLSLSANLLPSMSFGDGSHELLNSTVATANSLTTGGNSLLSGNSTLQQSLNMKADSLTSTGAVSIGLPTSPLSFSSSNVSLPRSSGFSMSSVSHPNVTPINRLETTRDPTMHPCKLMKLESGYQPMHNIEDPSKFGWQFDMNNFDATRQVFGTTAEGKFEHQFKVQNVIAPRKDFYSNEQQLAQLHAMSAAKAMQKDFLQQQAAQNRLQRGNTGLSAQLHRHDLLQQQTSHVYPQILQQRLLQQEQLLRMLPPQLQRSHVLQQQRQLQQQHQVHQLQHHSPGISKQQDKLDSGSCSHRLMQFIHRQRMRPADNNIGFWREFTAEFFAPSSRKRWCLSQCSIGGRNKPSGIFPQELWCCNICGSSPGRGFEVAVEVMPRLFKSKFDNGELEELLFVDLPHEYRLSSGPIVLEYAKAIQESVYDHLRVVWEGQLRIIFTPELKILSWDFCAKKHEELLPRRSVVPQVNQLVGLASEYQSMVHNSETSLSVQELQAICNVFVSCVHQLANNLELPCVNELGFTKRFVRCIQIAEVVNSMKDLIDFGRENNLGPIESLAKFPNWRSSSAVANSMGQNECSGLGAGKRTNVSFVQGKTEGQGNLLGWHMSDHKNLVVQPGLQQQGVASQPNLAYNNDPSAVGTPSAACSSAVNSLQASPTSSLSSYHTNFSTLTNNSESLGPSLQNHYTGNSCNVNSLQQQQPLFQQHLQPIDPIRDGAVQQFLHGGMISSQPRPGFASGQRINGNLGRMNPRNTQEVMTSSLSRHLQGLNTSIDNVCVNGGGTEAISETCQE